MPDSQIAVVTAGQARVPGSGTPQGSRSDPPSARSDSDRPFDIFSLKITSLWFSEGDQ
jgi:hypothetical protein